MALVIDEAFLPATLTGHPMTDEEFAVFCTEHPDLSFEMSAEGEIIVMPLTSFRTGVRNSRITRQVDEWAEADGRGLACDSSTGFVLPNGARRSPDAAWVLVSRIKEMDEASQERFLHLGPDFVIELQSASDRSKVLDAKMREWMENGAKLGWLIDPESRSVTIYRADGTDEKRTNIDSIAGEGLMEGFVLDLTRVWNPQKA